MALTRDEWLEKVKKNGWALEDVLNELRDRDMCMEAVKSKGSALCFVPEELRDRDICMEAVKKNDWALQYVPDEIRNGAETAEDFLAAMGTEAAQQTGAGMGM